MNATSHFKVEGLDCAEEVAVLNRDVGRRAGVVELHFDVINARMTVTHDSDRISQQDIISAVAGTGMRATPWVDREPEKPQAFRQRHGRLLMASLSGLFLAAGFAVHWYLHGNLSDALTGKVHGHDLPLPSLLLYVCSILTGVWFVMPRAVLAARKLRLDMNFLMTVAILGAIGLGDWLEAATIAFLFAVALLLEHWSVERARRAIGALLDVSPTRARVMGPDSGAAVEMSVEEVPVHSTVLVRPSEKIPLDGQILRGQTRVNQAPITGESAPVAKRPGDTVFAGTINGDGAIEFEVTRPATDTTLARIIHLVQEAQSRRAPTQQWVDRFSLYYTPAMILLSILVILVPPLLLGGAWSQWFYRGLVILVIACPCALVISTPVSIVSALTAAVRHGILIKGGRYLEEAGHLKVLALDKTGTLTYGQPRVQHVVPFNGYSRQELLAKAAALEHYSNHPLARAIVRAAQEENIPLPVCDTGDFQVIQGKGAQARIDGRQFWIGSHRLMHEKNQETPDAHDRALALEDAGHSVVIVGNDRHVLGLISVSDGIREHAPEAVAALKHVGIHRIVMLTGDNAGTAQAVAGQTGVDAFEAELLPEDKLRAIKELVAVHRHVGMVGDGVNDAPAMAGASLGIAMGAMGTDAAIETADIALMSDDLTKLPWLIRHSRRTLGIIKQNIFFALGLKILFIVLGLLGIATLWMAIATDMGASLLVIFNGLRLLGIQDTARPTNCQCCHRDKSVWATPERVK